MTTTANEGTEGSKDGSKKGLRFEEVARQELEAICIRRRGKKDPEDLDSVAPQLFGLALSGGGIRSATFNLGVLQGLSEMELLKRVDYLSTVSGGGFIGSWLHAWTKRAEDCGQGGIAHVEERLRDGVSGKRDTEPREVRFLRRFSNYLTPRMGFFGADTWTMVSQYVANLVLTQLVLFAWLAALLLLPLVIGWSAHEWGHHIQSNWWWTLGLLAVSVIPLMRIGLWVAPKWWRGDVRDDPAHVRRNVVVPIVLAAFFLTLALSAYGRQQVEQPWAFLILVGYMTIAAVVFWWPLIYRKQPHADVPRERPQGTFVMVPPCEFPRILITTAFSGAFGGALLGGLDLLFRSWGGLSGEGAHLIVTLGPPAVVGVFWLAVTVLIGLGSELFTDSNREWWSRIGAWLLILALAWIAAFAAALYGPVFLRWAGEQLGAWSKTGGLLAWLGPTLAGLFAAKHPSTGGRGSNKGMELLAALAPYVFIGGLLCLIALLLTQLIFLPGDGLRISITASAVVLLWLLSRRFDVNRLAMHAFYRNRLTRCYLGASNRGRKEDRFTGFDRGDDLPMAGLNIKNGPFPLVNATLNLTSSEKLAWQERQAASFTFSPLHCGFAYPEVEENRGSRNKEEKERAVQAYRPTGEFANESDLPSQPCESRGVQLSTCMATSGAAASPNMGYHSSPALSFLLTLFNVRLGWWGGNPNHPSAWRTTGPGGGIKYLVDELLGNTSAKTDYVNLSDGGHFDNLGVYELVRRKCRFILVVDAGADGSYSFDDLGNVIRKCRADFGVNIDIDARLLRRDAATGVSSRHVAVGTITYPLERGVRGQGILVYLKPTLTGNEPADVGNYAARHPTFPHQSTADQWFDESQFESYRRLGLHEIREAIDGVWRAMRRDCDPALASVFEALRQRWYRPSQATAEHFTRHGEALDDLFRRLRGDPDLAFLDEQFYPEWARFVDGAKRDPDADAVARAKQALLGSKAEQKEVKAAVEALWLPVWRQERRDAFYFCNSLFQLMENVYLDLNLEEEYAHPDNSGWMNLFRHWTWSNTFRIAWAISGSTYGRRFRWFCEQRLDLALGRLEIGARRIWSEDPAPTIRGKCGELKRALAKLEKKNELNFHECKLIKEFFAFNDHTLGDASSRVYLLQIQVDDVRKKAEPFRFTCGYALTLGKTIVMLRIQDHLRGMGRGMEAVGHLSRRENLGAKARIADVRSQDEWDRDREALKELRRRAPTKALRDSYTGIGRRGALSESSEDALIRMEEEQQLVWPTDGVKSMTVARTQLTDDPERVDVEWESGPHHLQRLISMLFGCQAARDHTMQAAKKDGGNEATP